MMSMLSKTLMSPLNFIGCLNVHLFNESRKSKFEATMR